VQTLRSDDRFTITARGEPIGEQTMSTFGENRLRMKLHTFNSEIAMPDCHDDAGVRGAGYFKLVWHGVRHDG
jgi:hypothetical protein